MEQKEKSNAEITEEELSKEQEEGKENVSDEGLQMASLQDEIKESAEKYVRLLAEFENYKRVNKKEAEQSLKFAAENILRDILPLIDNLEQAISLAKNQKEEKASKDLIIGVEMVVKIFAETVKKYGVQKIAVSPKDQFDPKMHEAILSEEAQGFEEGQIVNILQSGYKIHERLLRPARVSVCKAS